MFNKTFEDAETSGMGSSEGHQEVPVLVCRPSGARRDQHGPHSAGRGRHLERIGERICSSSFNFNLAGLSRIINGGRL